jgi:hypothetical protein
VNKKESTKEVVSSKLVVEEQKTNSVKNSNNQSTEITPNVATTSTGGPKLKALKFKK